MKPSEAIAALIAQGMTETSIGTAVGARQSTINRIKSGAMVPNWETGQKLVDLAASMPAANEHESTKDLAA
jgi:DNA-binding XRE family transcriptional regulator